MITRSIVLPVEQAEAFRIFTERIDGWWPAGHRPLGGGSEVQLDRESGRFFERTLDGREADLGHVNEWAPPVRLVLGFYLGTGPDAPTEVTVSFVTEREGTRVRIEHRPTAVSEGMWEQRVARYEENWPIVLESLQRYVGRERSGEGPGDVSAP